MYTSLVKKINVTISLRSHIFKLITHWPLYMNHTHTRRLRNFFIHFNKC